MRADQGSEAAALWWRWCAATLALTAGIAAALMFLQYASATRLSHWAWLAALLLGLSTCWLAWGAVQGLIGLRPGLPRPPEAPVAAARTVVLVPICNEDATTTFARVAAMHRQLADAGVPMDFAILSDTRSADGARDEERALARLRAEVAGVTVSPRPDGAEGQGGRILYRRRVQNHGRKAGNIAEFIRRSGAAWDYAVVLDADSLMEARTILAMVRRMQADPDLGLLQSLPAVVRARSLFGRAMQFSAAFHGPVFTRGLARMQGRTGPFWGHNAIIRLRAFAQCCGLPDLPGAAPFGGHILSHDYVEAALLARGGWTVRVDPDLGGSYEEAPENLVEHAKRDRRWCQGNLQHAALLRTAGLRFWSRAVFVQGILSYLSSGLWALFLVAATLAGVWQAAPDYFPGLVAIYHDRIGFLPVFPTDESVRALGLLIGIFGLLLLPKLLVAVEAVVTGRARGHGGVDLALVSVLVELLLSALLAPVLMAFQCRSLIQVLSGRDGGWPPNLRGDGLMSLRQAWAASRFITLAGLIALVAAQILSPEQLPWLLPVVLPMVLAPVLIAWTSHPLRAPGLFLTPAALSEPPILTLHRTILTRWQDGAETDAPPALAVGAAPLHGH